MNKKTTTTKRWKEITLSGSVSLIATLPYLLSIDGNDSNAVLVDKPIYIKDATSIWVKSHKFASDIVVSSNFFFNIIPSGGGATSSSDVSKSYVDTALESKADKSTTYTKAEVDAKMSNVVLFRVGESITTSNLPNGAIGIILA